MLLLHNKGQ